MAGSLGDVKTIDADEDDLATVAAITELSLQTVRKRWQAAHGSMLLRNVFGNKWPLDGDSLGRCTIALARDAGLGWEISDVSGLSERAVARRLNGSAGNMLVANAFPELAEDDDDVEEDDDVDDEPNEREHEAERTTLAVASEVELLGATRVVSARSQAMTSWLAGQLGWPLRKVKGRLARTHGRTLLRNALEDAWPISIGGDVLAMLGDQRAAAARRSASLSVWVGRKLRRDVADIAERLDAADGNTLLRNIFAPWPVQGSTPSPAPSPRRHDPVDRVEKREPNREVGTQRQLGPGSVVGGHWRIVRAIGDRGGFGTVFEVTDETKPDRDFVMKVADGPTPQQRATNEERLREEVRIAHRVTHQNACAYLEDRLDPASGVYYAIMKYAGDSLQKLLQSGDCFELLDAVDIVSQIADALDYAHAKRGIIHQDVKPANILVQGTIGAREARIGDWGISRFGRDTRRADGSPTVIATVVGMSAGYTAPEQYRGEARSASDQYCLALVFCSLLEGRVFAEHYRPRQLEQLSAAQNMTVFRALSPEPEDRFGSCGTFAAKLRDA